MSGLSLRHWAPLSLRSLVRSLEDWPTIEETDFPVDISRDKEDRVVVRATLPGFKKEEVAVKLDNNELLISAEHKEDNESKGEDYYRRERTWKSFSRTITLPGQAAKNGVDAELKDGVLTVRVPQAKEAKAHSIKIN